MFGTLIRLLRRGQCHRGEEPGMPQDSVVLRGAGVCYHGLSKRDARGNQQ